jgi:8-oxo-dGTP pyrophosphatase MutT (NUDIX family)
VLLTLHSRIGRWLQTGGHLEPTDSTLEAAAVREAREESGLADLALEPSPLLLSKHEVPCGSVRPTYHLDVQYLVIANQILRPKVGNESLDLRWFPHDQLPGSACQPTHRYSFAYSPVFVRLCSPRGAFCQDTQLPHERHVVPN